MTTDFALDVDAVPRAELPALLGRVVEIEARIRLRLIQPEHLPAPVVSRVLSVDEAVAVANAPSRRWLLHHTAGHRCRRDLSRKVARFDEAELRRWLVDRRPR